MNEKLTVFVVQATNDRTGADFLESGIILKLLASPTVSVTAINSLEPSKITMAEHMHLLTLKSHIVVITFDSLNTTRQYLLELNINGELIDAGKLRDNGRLSNTPVRKIFLACIDRALDNHKVESDVFQALMIAKNAVNDESTKEFPALPVIQRDERKKQVEHPFSSTIVIQNERQSEPMGQIPFKANFPRKNVGNCYIENLVNDLDNADV